MTNSIDELVQAAEMALIEFPVGSNPPDDALCSQYKARQYLADMPLVASTILAMHERMEECASRCHETAGGHIEAAKKYFDAVERIGKLQAEVALQKSLKDIVAKLAAEQYKKLRKGLLLAIRKLEADNAALRAGREEDTHG